MRLPRLGRRIEIGELEGDGASRCDRARPARLAYRCVRRLIQRDVAAEDFTIPQAEEVTKAFEPRWAATAGPVQFARRSHCLPTAATASAFVA